MRRRLSALLFASAMTQAVAASFGIATSVTGGATVSSGAGGVARALRVSSRVSDGDIVRLSPGAKVTLVCADLSRRTFSEAVAVVDCTPSTASVFKYGTMDLPAPRGVDPLLMPRATL